MTNQARLRADVPLSTYVFKSLNHFSSDGVGWNFSTNHYLEHRIRSIILESNIIQDIYRYIFQKGLTVSHAKEIVAEMYGNTPEGKEVIDFIDNAQVGLMKGFNPDR